MPMKKEPRKENSLSERERLDGSLRLLSLREQVSQGTIGKAYLWKERLMQDVQKVLSDLAPNGVGSQQEFLELLDKAVLQVDKEQRRATTSESEMIDIEHTLNMIQRTLKMVPYQVYFSS